MSVLVPVLDEASGLPAFLDHLAELPGDLEVIVADGGSSDGSPEIARSHPSSPRVLAVLGGRARQLNAAAAEARGSLLVFLHADSRLPRSACGSLALIAPQADVAGGNFEIRFDGGDRFSRVLGAWYAAQRRFGIYYGDSAVFVRREVFNALGGYRALQIMDDYDFVRRLERSGRTVCLPGPTITSARRWRKRGITRTIASWVVIRWLFLAGVSDARLAGLYRAVR